MPDFSARVAGTPTKLISHRIGLGRGKDGIEKELHSFAVARLKRGEEGG